MNSLDNLVVILSHAASVNSDERVPAETALLLLEVTSGHHLQLQQIYLNASLDPRLRSLAVISLKNGIDKYWRRSAPNAIQEQEKAEIRKHQLEYFGETLKHISNQKAYITSKIARHDFPTAWPELLSTLLPMVESSFVNETSPNQYLIQQNLLYTLHLSMKQIASKALPVARKSLRDISPQIFRFMLGVFDNRMDYFFGREISREDHFALDQSLSIARIALKCMRRMICHGFNNILDSPDAQRLLSTLYQYLPKLFQVKQNLPDSTKGIPATICAISILIGKLYIDIEESDVVHFVLSSGSIEVIKFYWSFLQNSTASSRILKLTQEDSMLEKIIIQSLKLLKNVVKHPQFTIVSSSNHLI